MKKKVQKAKRKSLVEAPKHLGDVNELVSELGTIDRLLQAEKARLEALFERMRKASLEAHEAVALKRADIVKEITKYAKKYRADILPVDRKSVELSAGTIGWRLGQWKVEVAGEEETLITWLETEERTEYLRYLVELNREQLLADRPTDIPSIHFEQKERFFIEPKEETSLEASSSVVSMVRIM